MKGGRPWASARPREIAGIDASIASMTIEPKELSESQELGLQDLVAVLKRRKWYLIVATLVVLAASWTVALVLPPVYLSETIILIEEPDVPQDLVASTITGFAAYRVKAVSERVTTTQNLVGIITKFELYEDQRAYLPIDSVAEKMRDKITLKLISAEERKSRQTRPDTIIAFKLTFEHGTPTVAQQVLNELVSLYISENLKARQDKVSKTVAFLAEESRRLEQEIVGLEKEAADLKERFADSLPAQLDENLSALAKARAELRELDQSAETLPERQAIIEAQLREVTPYLSNTILGEQTLPNERLASLRSELVALSARYKPEYPTVVQLRREIEALEKSLGVGTQTMTLQRNKDGIQADLTRARQEYSDDHPRVLELQHQLNDAESKLNDGKPRNGDFLDRRLPDNPAYVELKARLEASRSESKALSDRRAAVKAAIAEYQTRLEQTPLFEREYQRVMRAYESARLEHQAIKQKRLAAQLSENLESERKGERFSLVDPPSLPAGPEKPQRLVLMVLGLVFSFGSGVAAVMLAELIDSSVYGSRQILAITGTAPLIVVPYIKTRADTLRTWGRGAALATLSTLVVVGAATYVHLQVKPLDLLWVQLQIRLQMALWPILTQL
jgi:uncharacterized protein involved in exopolysaccharide biosynthesis